VETSLAVFLVCTDVLFGAFILVFFFCDKEKDFQGEGEKSK